MKVIYLAQNFSIDLETFIGEFLQEITKVSKFVFLTNPHPFAKTSKKVTPFYKNLL